MSVDVFGRKLDKKEGTRGPPGVGYKLTENGQFDADSKRICNLAHPIQANDAVNLDFLSQLLDAELRSIKTITAQLQKDINDIKYLIDNKFIIVKELKKKR